MKKNFFILACFLLFSCETMTCPPESQSKINSAQSMYNSFGTFLARDVSNERAAQMFGCHYKDGDDVYLYKTLWNKKYILVRDGVAISYVEEK